jgi:hypothetical protein
VDGGDFALRSTKVFEVGPTYIEPGNGLGAFVIEAPILLNEQLGLLVDTEWHSGDITGSGNIIVGSGTRGLSITFRIEGPKKLGGEINLIVRENVVQNGDFELGGGTVTVSEGTYRLGGDLRRRPENPDTDKDVLTLRGIRIITNQYDCVDQFKLK